MMSFVEKWVELEIFMLSGINQAHRWNLGIYNYKYDMIVKGGPSGGETAGGGEERLMG
jgi:hypothetical protein